MAKKFDFDKVLREFQKKRSQLPRMIAKEAVNFSNDAFRRGGWTDDTFDPWVARKRPNKADRATGRRRALLVDSGNLRRSIRASKTSFNEIRIGAYGIAYATYHNQGTDKMAKRKFLGKSAVLNKKISSIIRREIASCFQ